MFSCLHTVLLYNNKIRSLLYNKTLENFCAFYLQGVLKFDWMLAFDISCLMLAGKKDFLNFAPLNGISFCSIFGLNVNVRFAILCKHFLQKAQRCFSKYATVEYVTVRSINIYSHRRTALFQNNRPVQSIIIQNSRVTQ